MVDFAPGMRIIIRDEEWMVKKIEINSMGNRALHCVGVSTLVKDRDAVFLTDLEQIKIVNPADIRLIADSSAHYKRSLLYVESQWRQKIPTDDALHIGDRAAMDSMPYQLEPAHMALGKPRQRILIADSVGLGKTLEAGILIAELIKRGKGKRILVVTTKSMMTQFQKEMWNRFTIPLIRLDSQRIQRIRASLPSNANPFFYYDKTIISVDTLKSDVEYRTHLEKAYWDIIVIDEAQNVAERGDRSQRSRLAKLLAGRSDTMIMLSATPHDGRARSFASLMNMLDPTAIANPENYTADDIKGLFVRRFKKDIKNQVKGEFLERKISIEHCDASPKEEKVFRIFADMELQMDLTKKKGSGQLFKTSLEKSLFSSPAACVQTISHRLSTLRRKYEDDQIKDIAALEELKVALQDVAPEDFSRYQHLLSLLRSSSYGWDSRAVDDRLVIFTERIETMKYLAAHLKEDLHLKDQAVREISGAMSDVEQNKIVEDFGREESPVRILVASDVASEGLNLHYLSHRLIHFDIPWSLMTFQQRNGRIDRYGQKKQPDIRYMLIQSRNVRIKGDARIMEILVQKEDQASQNIGDPAMLMGLYDSEAEETQVMGVIENGSDAAAFEASLSRSNEPFDFLSALLGASAEPEKTVQTVTDETLYSDLEYTYQAVSYLNRNTPRPVERHQTVAGLDVTLTEEMRRRLKALIPDEVMPRGDTLRLSTDKQFCMEEMKRSMMSSMEVTAWPEVQYLWPLHPLMSWLNDKNGLLFGRGEAPFLYLPDKMPKGEILYIVCGSIPNEKSTPLVDEWFGLLYRNGKFDKALTMPQVMMKTGLRNPNLINPGDVPPQAIKEAESLLPDVVESARLYLSDFYTNYKQHMDPLLDAELNKLAELEKKHEAYQLSLFGSERKHNEEIRRVNDLFDSFEKWVTETLTIKDNPYIRIIAAVKGA